VHILVSPNGYRRVVPRISSFYGIVIWMCFNDHNPPTSTPSMASGRRVSLSTLSSRWTMSFPGGLCALFKNGRLSHGDELMANWDKARAGQPLGNIEPLP
jgi:hypothetical protein